MKRLATAGLRARVGYTAIELVLGILAASILALTMGTLIYLGNIGWRNNLEAVNLQRDATFAMDLIAHTVRPATRAGISVVSSNRLDVAGTNAIRSIYFSNGDLYYDPSTAVSGNEVLLVRGRVSDFAVELSPTNAGPGVVVSLRLEDGESRVSVNSLTHWRN